MGPIGFNEILIILVIVLLLFGAKKIPELMRGVGKGVREFNDAKSNARKNIEDGISEKEVRAEPAVMTPSKNRVYLVKIFTKPCDNSHGFFVLDYWNSFCKEFIKPFNHEVS